MPLIARNNSASAFGILKPLDAPGIGACMEQDCSAARHLASRLRADGLFELCAPVAPNIVCFSVRGNQADAVNRWIVDNLHVSGEAASSLTMIDGRAAIRTTIADIDAFVAALNRRAAYRAASVKPLRRLASVNSRIQRREGRRFE